MIKLNGTGPLHQQIYRSLRENILSGQFASRSKLPVTRVLAEELGVSRNVVLIAYEQLVIEGYATSRVGSGTYVSAVIPDEMITAPESNPERHSKQVYSHLSEYGKRVSKQSELSYNPPGTSKLQYDFAYGRASKIDYPDRLWRRLTARILRRPSLGYAYPAGNAALRGAICEYLRRARAVRCTPEQVLIVNGTQQAITLVTRLLLDPGDAVLMENPHYDGARQIFLAGGARVLGTPVDTEGLRVDRLPFQKRRLRFAYVTPSHQFPMGGLLPLERRLKLLSWAERTDACILEDDYDSEFRYDGRAVESVQGLGDGQRVIYIGTFSKIMFPALRLGYMVVPEQSVPLFTRAKLLEDLHTASLQQQVLAEFIHQGHFERHLRICRARNASRRAALLEAIDEHLGDSAEISGATAGRHIILWLKNLPADRQGELISAAAREGVGLYSVNRYYLKPPARCGFMIGYGALSECEIREAIRILGACAMKLV